MADKEQDAQGSPEHIIASKSTELTDRTADAKVDSTNTQEPSKNALKKARKQERLAAENANKSTGIPAKDVGKAEAKKAVSKTPAKKIPGTAQIGIDVAKEDDFAAWYQQVLTKGEMLDYYDVSGCYILKVSHPIPEPMKMLLLLLTKPSPPHSSSGRRYKSGSTRTSKALESRIVPSPCSYLRMSWNARRHI
jgi:hypothetical protein